MADYSDIIPILSPNEKQRAELQSGLERLALSYPMNLAAYGKDGRAHLEDASKPEDSKYRYLNTEALKNRAAKLKRMLDDVNIMLSGPEYGQVRVVKIDELGCVPPPVVKSSHLENASAALKLAVKDVEVAIGEGALRAIVPSRMLRDEILRLIMRAMSRPINRKGDIEFTIKAYMSISNEPIDRGTIENRLKEINNER